MNGADLKEDDDKIKISKQATITHTTTNTIIILPCDALDQRAIQSARKMGAIDPIIHSTKNSSKSPKQLRSVSIDSYSSTNNNIFSHENNMAAAANSRQNNLAHRPALLSTSVEYDNPNNNKCDSSKGANNHNIKEATLQQKARNLLAPMASNLGMTSDRGKPGGGLKSSLSTTCLFTDDDNTSSSSSLDTNPSRASLTHEWKKLKTLNKCRECNLLVYFNGRECTSCGFVGHKKCLTLLVIKCSGRSASSCDDWISLNPVLPYGTALAQKFKKASSPQPADTDGCRTSPPNNLKANTSCKNQQVKPIFGQPLDESQSRQVIDFIRRFIYEIDSRGLDTKGIYRVSSIKSKVDRLCTYFDQNLSSLIDLSSFHPNIIANVLKMYLRQLPEPLLTKRLYCQFIELAKKYANSTIPETGDEESRTRRLFQSLSSYSKPRKSLIHGITVTDSLASNSAYNPMLIVEIKEVIEQLPVINRELIALIMRHLRRVANMSFENQMSAKNLSIIFGPTLLSESSNGSTVAIVDNVHQARIIELMITWADQIFPQYENYESKAVIDLISPLPTRVDPHYPGSEDETLATRKRDKTHTSNCQCPKHQAAAGIIGADNDYHRHKQSDTRSELQELRRKFFTEPEKTTATATQPPDNRRSSIISTITNKLSSANTNLKNKSTSRPINQPEGSVPLIKVQPYYCNTLNKEN